jgi:pimeloyl-ACP methyl ester carboxylesterase
MKARYGPENPDTYVAHAFPERQVDLGEIRMNYAEAGDPDRPALLLIPGQSESWWGYEDAMQILADDFNVFAVDLRGQGRSTRTPGRYTLDNMGNDLVRFIDLVIGRPTYVSGLSSGGVLTAWLSAYAKPGMVIAAHYEDPPLFASELKPACGHSIRQGAGPMFRLWSKYLGDQWSIGDWEGMMDAAPHELPPWFAARFAEMREPPQNMKEYDPEWGRAFWEGTVCVGCDHETLLRQVRTPVLFTHHFRIIDEATDRLIGAISDAQAARVRSLIEGAGQRFDYVSHPKMGHSMHGQDPALFSRTLREFVQSL